MSFVYDIRNLKDCKDFKNKREDFFKMLRLQAKLNRNFEQATIARQQMEQLGVTPVMQARRSLEDESKDLMLQQQLAIKNLLTIMTPEEARRTIHVLTDEDVYFMNTEFGRVAPFLQGRTNITANYFKHVIQRFKLYLQSTAMTGIPIPLRDTTLQRLPGDLLDEWDHYMRQHIDPTTGTTVDLEELIRRSAEILNRTVDDLKQEVAEHDAMEVEAETPIEETPIMTTARRGTKRKPAISRQNMNVKRPRTMEESAVERTLEQIVTGVDMDQTPLAPEEPFTGMTTRGMKRGQPDYRSIFKKEGPATKQAREMAIGEAPFEGMTRPPVRGMKRGQPDYRSIFKTEGPPAKKTSAIVRGVDRQDNAFVTTQGARLAASGRLTLEQARAMARAEIEQRQRAYVPPARTVRPRPRLTPIPLPEQNIEMDVVPYYDQQAPATSLAEAKRLARQEIVARGEQRAAQLEQGTGLFISPQRTTEEYGAPAVFSRFSSAGGGMTYSKNNKKVMTRHGKAMKAGKGIQANDESDQYTKYKQMGRYKLHVPSLSKSMISVKYPSLVRIPDMPCKFVSADFIQLLWKLLDEETFEKTIFNRLNEDEQDYFRFLARRCQFDQVIGLGFGESQTKEEEKDMQRFEMLRGTIIAGNNSPEVLKEMQRYVLKFLMEKRIPKQQGHDLLYEMSCLQVA